MIPQRSYLSCKNIQRTNGISFEKQAKNLNDLKQVSTKARMKEEQDKLLEPLKDNSRRQLEFGRFRFLSENGSEYLDLLEISQVDSYYVVVGS